MITTQDVLVSCIQTVLDRLGWQFTSQDVFFELPENNRYGDLSSNIALRLSRPLKRTPLEIANTIIPEIKKELRSFSLNRYIKDIETEGGGFINFYFNDNYFYEQLAELISKGREFLKVDFGKGKPVLIEFVSANPTGPLSVAHARQAAVGDSLANILDFLGFKVKKEYYLNDEGNQIDILGKSVELRLRELNGEKLEFPKDYYQGDYIWDIAKKIKEQKSKSKNLKEFAMKYILSIIKKELDDFGIKFDYWYSQKELRKSKKIEKALAFLKKKGFLYEKDSALWFKSSCFRDDKDRVIIKSDGTYTYVAWDIAYHQGKYKRKFNWLINLWGPDHHGYIKRLQSAVLALGKPLESLSIVIVQLASVKREGKTIEMSTRKGQYITLREVLDEVGSDASRFFFLMRRTSSHLDFDLDIAKKQTPENPVYYVQYAHARICSILSNSQMNPVRNTKDIRKEGKICNGVKIKKNVDKSRTFAKVRDLSILKEKEEIELIKKSLQFTYILSICLETIDPYMLTVYLQELSETFHKFYDRHRVLGEDNLKTCARLGLIEATKIVISTGLELLGVSIPEKM